MLPFLVLGLLYAGGATALDNGVGKLPALGFNTWNIYQCDYTADELLQQARAMVDRGLLEAGYNIFMLDDCYSLRERNAQGRIVEDPKKFPHGMKSFTKALADLGFRAGIYSDAGYRTCAGYPGSYGHESEDLETFADWGFDYLKYDNCNIPPDNVTQENVYGRYVRMVDAIRDRAEKTKTRPFQLALCEWGWQQPWIWGHRLGQSWRTGGDIRPWWSALASILNQASFIASATNFYAHNDFDMLEVGNTGRGTPPGNLTYDEAKSHFTAWALLKSPLLIGSDMAAASKETIEILTNKDVLKISQDPNVGESIAPFRWGYNRDYTWDPAHPAEYWTGNSSYGVVFMVLNTANARREMSFDLAESWAIRAGRAYNVYDMWSHTNNGTVVRNMTITLPPRGVTALLLTDAGPEPAGLPPCAAQAASQCALPDGSRPRS
ncbi:glycoside hydrolase family 27 protein [Canariomyces notabilis]|uniref:Alpha-galactosidase n=1 Tax=Canariomyces notabilis TaxID=2074819 RepID=A0AAN6QIE1_9PEZI|nr:glycoside hydrolase family 27 protein [Canariomyces arenarius]